MAHPVRFVLETQQHLQDRQGHSSAHHMEQAI
jgi:hypothetical protein